MSSHKTSLLYIYHQHKYRAVARESTLPEKARWHNKSLSSVIIYRLQGLDASRARLIAGKPRRKMAPWRRASSKQCDAVTSGGTNPARSLKLIRIFDRAKPKGEVHPHSRIHDGRGVADVALCDELGREVGRGVEESRNKYLHSYE